MQNSGLRESKSVGVGIESLTLWPTNGSAAWLHNWCLIETRKSGNGKWITFFRGQLARRFRNKSKTKASFRLLQFRDACPALRIWFGYGYSFSFAFIYFFFLNHLALPHRLRLPRSRSVAISSIRRWVMPIKWVVILVTTAWVLS